MPLTGLDEPSRQHGYMEGLAPYRIRFGPKDIGRSPFRLPLAQIPASAGGRLGPTITPAQDDSFVWTIRSKKIVMPLNPNRVVPRK